MLPYQTGLEIATAASSIVGYEGKSVKHSLQSLPKMELLAMNQICYVNLQGTYSNLLYAMAVLLSTILLY